MTLSIYVGKNYSGYPDEYHTSHEVLAVRDICADLYDFCGESDDFHCAVIANPQGLYDGLDIKPDLVIITEYGLGIIELKDHQGKISIVEGKRGQWDWYVDRRNRLETRGSNPQQQVHHSAEGIRRVLFSDVEKWIPSYRTVPIPENDCKNREFKIATAICFTHPKADIENIGKDNIDNYYSVENGKLCSWEKFEVFKQPYITNWVSSIRLEETQGPVDGWGTYKLTPPEIDNIASHFFNVVEWESMRRLIFEEGIPPYGHLNMKNSSWSQRLNRQQMLIGRSRECRVQIPNREDFQLVSGIHARIYRDGAKTYLENLGRNGTYIDGKAITEHTALKHGQSIILGASEDKLGSCELVFLDKQKATPTLQTMAP